MLSLCSNALEEEHNVLEEVHRGIWPHTILFFWEYEEKKKFAIGNKNLGHG